MKTKSLLAGSLTALALVSSAFSSSTPLDVPALLNQGSISLIDLSAQQQQSAEIQRITDARLNRAASVLERLNRGFGRPGGASAAQIERAEARLLEEAIIVAAAAAGQAAPDRLTLREATDIVFRGAEAAEPIVTPEVEAAAAAIVADLVAGNGPNVNLPALERPSPEERAERQAAREQRQAERAARRAERQAARAARRAERQAARQAALAAAAE